MATKTEKKARARLRDWKAELNRTKARADEKRAGMKGDPLHPLERRIAFDRASGRF